MSTVSGKTGSGKMRSPNLSLETAGVDNMHVRNRTSPKTANSNAASASWGKDDDTSKSKVLFRKRDIFCRLDVIFILIACLILLTYFQFSLFQNLMNGKSESKLLYPVAEKKVEIESSILPQEQSSSGHVFWLGIDKVRSCDLNDGVAHLIPGNAMDENTYYTHHIHVRHGGWVYGQLCISPHDHEHVVEIYLDLSEHAKAESKKDFDCDVYISSHKTFPEEQSWDFRSNNKGNDHIKLPLYLDDFKDSQGVIVLGIFGRGGMNEANQCSVTLKVNTLENEELLKKFNLRHGQVLSPRDLGFTGSSVATINTSEKHEK